MRAISSFGKLTFVVCGFPVASIRCTTNPYAPSPAESPGFRLHAAKFADFDRLSKIACASFQSLADAKTEQEIVLDLTPFSGEPKDTETLNPSDFVLDL